MRYPLSAQGEMTRSGFAFREKSLSASPNPAHIETPFRTLSRLQRELPPSKTPRARSPRLSKDAQELSCCAAGAIWGPLRPSIPEEWTPPRLTDYSTDVVEETATSGNLIFPSFNFFSKMPSIPMQVLTPWSSHVEPSSKSSL